MTPQPREPLTSYTGREDYETSHRVAGVVQYTAPCATCLHLATYVAVPSEPLRVWCPTCEAGS